MTLRCVLFAFAVIVPLAVDASVFSRFEREILSSIKCPVPAALPVLSASFVQHPVLSPPYSVPSFELLSVPPEPSHAVFSLQLPGRDRLSAGDSASESLAAVFLSGNVLPASGGIQAARVLPVFVPVSPPVCNGDAIYGRLVFEGIRDGLINPRLPSSRAPLAAFLLHPGPINRDDIFAALLGTFPGHNMPERIKAAEAWASASAGADAEREIAVFSIRRLFLDGNYDAAVAKADSVAARFPEVAARANLVKALSLAQSGDYDTASRTLALFENDPDFASDRAEIRFMQAWIAIQKDCRADAAAILRSIIADHPRSPFAERSRQALSLLEEN